MSAKHDHSTWTGDKRYVRRDNDGRFRESDDVGRSLATDVRKHAESKRPAVKGDGDKKA